MSKIPVYRPLPDMSNFNAGNMFEINCRICGDEFDLSGITVGQYKKMVYEDIICNDCKIDIRDKKINEILK